MTETAIQDDEFDHLIYSNETFKLARKQDSSWKIASLAQNISTNGGGESAA